jgi:ABC-2 type transport system ATP-binding protein
MSIKVKDVTKIYGSQKALDKVSFEIKSGEIIGFLGPNGAGKSTMMKIIAGYIPQNDGEIYVNDTKIDAEAIEIRHEIGYLPEHNPLYLDMYVREYLLFVAGLYKIKDKKKRVEEMVIQTGLTKESSKRISELSKGYRQRVGLAQALIHDPSILILDEPTSGLDPNQIVEIRDLIAKVGKEKTVLLSTHIMQEVEAICDKIIIINQGKIVAKETTQNASKIIAKNYFTIEVEFDTEVGQNLLSGINSVIELNSKNKNTWLIKAHKDIRSQLFEFAVQNHKKVLSMQIVEKSLEEIFQEITQK